MSALDEFGTLGLLLILIGLVLLLHWTTRRKSPSRERRRDLPGSDASSSITPAAESALVSAARLSMEACARRGPEADRLFDQAYAGFRSAHALAPRHLLLLRCWGHTLTSHAARKPAADACRLAAEAGERFSAALTLAPGDAQVMAGLGTALLRRAKLTSGEISKTFLGRARELAERALQLTPTSVEALNLLAMALYDQSNAGPADEIDKALADLDIKFEEAARGWARTKGLETILNGWATLRFAQANRASGEKVRLLRDAEQKYAEQLSRDPGGSSSNLACVSARLGEFEECRKWLEKSGEPGKFVSREEMAADPELASVRHSEWFQELLQKPA